ncbi:MAG: sigma 54-interacting transcriptional regulator [Deltaproteobacteria bacterium]|nr:sigma 54-interacting transcriptional regulator [Deltaproteobacteria bacterium]
MSNLDNKMLLEVLRKRFSTEQACRAHLLKVRWPNGFVCPSCGHNEYYEVPKRFLLHCKRCHHQTSVTAGTIMHGTRTPLYYWFWAIHLTKSQKEDLTIKKLSDKIGLNYHAARRMLNKIQRDMDDQGFIHALAQSFNTVEPAITPLFSNQHEKPEPIPDDFHKIMSVAALFEGSFSIDWIIELTELSASIILSAFEKAINKEILTRKSAGEFCFKDEKQKVQFQDTFDIKEKALKHKKIANILLRNPNDNDEKILSIANHLLHLDNDLSHCQLLLKAGDIYRFARRYGDAYACHSKIMEALKDKEGDDEVRLYIQAVINSSKLVEATLNSHEIIPALKNALAKAESKGFKGQAVLLELNLAKNEWFLSNHANALKHFERGFSMSDAIDDDRLRRASAAFHIFYLYYQGRLKDVVNHYEMIMEDVEIYPHGHFSLMATVYIGVSYILTGQATQGFGLVDSIYNYSKESGDKYILCQTCHALGSLLLWYSRVDEALIYLDLGLQTAIGISNHWVETTILTQLAWAYYLKKQTENSVSYLKKYLRKVKRGDMFNIPYTALLELCWAMELGELPRVGNLSIKTEIERSIRSKNILSMGSGYYYKGLLLRRNGNPSDKTIQTFENAVKWRKKSGNKSAIASALLELSKEYSAVGSKNKALQASKKLEEIVHSIGVDLIPKDLSIAFKNLHANRDLLKEIMMFSQQITTIRDNKELVHHIISRANHITGAERGAIFIIDKDAPSPKLKLRAARNLVAEDITHPNFQFSMEAIQKVASTGDGYVFKINPGQKKIIPQSRVIKSCICVPMKYMDAVVGVLYHDNRLFSNHFKKTDLEILQYFAAQASIAMDNANAYEEINNLTRKLKEEKKYFEEQHLDSIHSEGIVGKSAALMRVLKEVDSVSGTDAAVLIQGETGVGKELIARAIHRSSPRKDGPFIRVNCSVFPDTLIASELFGHEKGAFTGATDKRLGRFELADKGTLFLDEIGDVSMEVQIRLLRVLQSKEFERVGGRKPLYSDFRLVAATNHDLQKLINEGKFREDLFFRLNVFPIHVPPIRDRIEDIPLLVQYFLKNYAEKFGKSVGKISAADMERLMSYDWPGNVRELENVIERGIILSVGDRFKTPDLKKGYLQAAPENQVITLAEIQRRHIIRAIKKTQGKIFGPGGAAEILDIHPQTLYSKMKKFNISKEQAAMQVV